jgi:hypothetical protein
MERALQYVWKQRLFADSDLTMTDGQNISVIDPGLQNSDAGPDFFNAKIRIGDMVWAGCVEIHERTSDWVTHHHDKDKAYDSVILHVVRTDDAEVLTSDNKTIPKAILKIPEKIEKNIEWLLSRDTPVSCSNRIKEIPPIYVSDWITALVTERLERKTKEIFMRMELNGKDWNEVFYITLMRNFGFGANSDAFELLAKSLPYKIILKHRNNPFQIEALLFGQAGLLNDEKAERESYFSSLRQEYDFLRKKYDLMPVDASLYKNLRMRPDNFAYVRIAQVAAVFIKNDLLFSQALETDDIHRLRNFFNVELSEFWKTHYHFRFASPPKNKSIGKHSANIILINTAVPIFFAYGKWNLMPEYCDRALRILEQIPAENNNITRLFADAGIKVVNACDSQALVQLRREYCDRKDCLRCRIGFRMIGR